MQIWALGAKGDRG